MHVRCGAREKIEIISKFYLPLCHAAAYAALCYITAYLKYHYPAEYMCAILTCTENFDKIPEVLGDCREIGLKVLPPNINKSELNFSVSNGKILFGLNSIKGTKNKTVADIIEEREKNGPFISFLDVLRRVNIDKSTMEGFIDTGAMDEFFPKRNAMKNAYVEGKETLEKIEMQVERIQKYSNKLKENPSDKRSKTSLEKAEKTLAILKKDLDIFKIMDIPEDHNQRLIREKNLLGFFITSHPMNYYKKPEEIGAIPINNLETKEDCDIIGVIENLEFRNRKKDGKEMAFFDLEDLSGIIHVCCFTKAYEEYGVMLAENAVVKVSGNLNVEYNEETDEENRQFFMKSLAELKPDEKSITLSIRDISEWNDVKEYLEKRRLFLNNGHPLIVYDRLNCEFRKTSLYVSAVILGDKNLETILMK